MNIWAFCLQTQIWKRHKSIILSRIKSKLEKGPFFYCIKKACLYFTNSLEASVNIAGFICMNENVCMLNSLHIFCGISRISVNFSGTDDVFLSYFNFRFISTLVVSLIFVCAPYFHSFTFYFLLCVLQKALLWPWNYVLPCSNLLFEINKTLNAKDCRLIFCQSNDQWIDLFELLQCVFSSGCNKQ